MEPIAFEKVEWMPDQSTLDCTSCKNAFTLIRRRHHCRRCGSIFCDPCSNYYSVLPAELGYSGPQRLCKTCHFSFEQKHKFYENDAFVGRLQLRSSSTYEYIRPLQDIGNSKNGLRKSYFLAKNDKSEEVMVSILTPTNCPWTMTSDKSKAKFIETLSALKHGYIYPTVNVETCGSNDKIFVFRNLSSKGSIKDLIFKSKPTTIYDVKYVLNVKKSYSSGVVLKSINKYGRQILEAMIYLKQKGITFTHLHTGNVMVSGDTCMLTDIENSFVGFKPLYHDYIVGRENPEVLCFGHVLFEMVVGCPLVDQQVQNFASVIPDSVMDVFKLIFVADNKSPPTLEELIAHPFFITGVQIELVSEGKLKKSQLQFIKDVMDQLNNNSNSNSYNSYNNISPRPLNGSGSNNNSGSSSAAPAPLKKQSSSTAILTESTTTNKASTPSPTNTTTSPTSSINPLMASVQEKRNQLKPFSSSTDLNSKKATPPPAPSGPPPPPPPPSFKSAPPPPPQQGRNALLESIRNPNNLKKLKKGPPSKTSTKKK